VIDAGPQKESDQVYRVRGIDKKKKQSAISTLRCQLLDDFIAHCHIPQRNEGILLDTLPQTQNTPRDYTQASWNLHFTPKRAGRATQRKKMEIGSY
jgi:hypothetical protein